MAIPHPAGGGRQQPDPADYTITAARYANAAETAAVIEAEGRGAVMVDAAAAPALWAKLRQGAVEGYRAPQEVPRQVSIRQAELVLQAAGKRAAVLAWVAQQSEEVQITWARAKDIERASPLVEAARVALEMTHREMDALFIHAAAIP